MMDWSTSQGKGAAATSPPNAHTGIESQRIEPAPAPLRMRVAIIGAGRGGTALFEVLHQIGTIEIVGIADKDPSAPGFKRAHEFNVSTYDQVADLSWMKP